MNSDNFMQTAHLLLGISRQELLRRISSQKLDWRILKSQIEQSALEIQLESGCEEQIARKSLEQVDKFSYEQ